jgi:hypothetical protein
LQLWRVVFIKTATRFIYIDDDNAIFEDNDMPIDGFKYFRVIGWQTIKGKAYWIFTYTLGDNWGIKNYRLIEIEKYNLAFINIKLIN